MKKISFYKKAKCVEVILFMLFILAMGGGGFFHGMYKNRLDSGLMILIAAVYFLSCFLIYRLLVKLIVKCLIRRS